MDMLIPTFVRVGQVVSGNFAPDGHELLLVLLGAKPCLEMARTFSTGQPRERRVEVLVPSGECLRIAFSVVPRNPRPKGELRQMVHDRRKNPFAEVDRKSPEFLSIKTGYLEGLRVYSNR